jgi:hypothetical protein
MIPRKAGHWVLSSEPSDKPEAITMPNAPDEILKQLSSKRPLKHRIPPPAENKEEAKSEPPEA